MSGRWALDRGLAADLTEALGWDPTDGPVALAERLPHRVLCGSTAKLAAIRAGRIPPGADVADLARTVLAVDRARRSEPPADSPAWSCWVLATLHAALVETVGLGPARVAAVRRIDEGPDVAPVDFHSAVVVAVDGGRVVCDPYFGLGLDLPPEGAGPNVAGPGPGLAEIDPGSDGRWELAVRLARWDQSFRYRVVAPDLDAGDVRTLCAISVQHSGVPSRPYARIHVDDAVLEVQEAGSGSFVAQRWGQDIAAGAEPIEREVFDRWDDAVDRFARWTALRPM